MEDEASVLLESKTLGNLRVVDLKQELEKRGLSKSGSKKDLVKRLKQQLEFEKLCGERKSTGECDLKLELDADTEQNEFVQQYLAQQQKIYAEQKEVRRLIELEEIQKSGDEKGSCDSTEGDDEVTAGDGDQTEPDEPSDCESRVEVSDKKFETNSKAPGNIDNQDNVPSSSTVLPSTEEVAESAVSSSSFSHQEDQIISSEIIQEVPVDSSIESTVSCEIIDHKVDQIASSEIIQNTSDVSRKTTNSPIPEPSHEMEPATQFSNVPYSLLDIQLPESPGNIVKPSKTTSDPVNNSPSTEKDSVNSEKVVDEIQSNGVDSSSVENTEDKKSESVIFESICDSSDKADNTNTAAESHENSEKVSGKHSSKNTVHSDSSKSHRSKESDSDVLSSKGSKRSDSDHKSSKSNKKDLKDQSVRNRDRKNRPRDSPRCRDSRSRSRESDRKARRYKKESEARKIHRNSRSGSRERSRRSRKSKVDPKVRKAVSHRAKSRSQSKDSRSSRSSDSEEEYRKSRMKSKETRRKGRNIKSESGSESDRKPRSQSRDSSPPKSSKRRDRQKDRKRKSESSRDSQSSRSRSPIQKKSGSISGRSFADSTALSQHKDQKRSESSDNGQYSRSKSRDSSPIEKKSKRKPNTDSAGSSKQKEKSHRSASTDGSQSPRSRSRESSPAQKRLKEESCEPVTDSTTPSKHSSQKETEHKHDSSGHKRSRSRSPVHKKSKSKLNEPPADSRKNKVRSKSESSEDDQISKNTKRESSPVEKKSKDRPLDELHTALPKHEETKEKSESSDGGLSPRSRSRETSPVHIKSENKLDEQSTDSVSSPKLGRLKEKGHETESSYDGRASRSRSRENSPVQATKVDDDEVPVSVDSVKRVREKSPSSEDDQDSKIKSKKSSPIQKKSKHNYIGASADTKISTEPEPLLAEVASPEKDEKITHGTDKPSIITVFKKEPVRQKLKIKRDNVIISASSQNKKGNSEKNNLTKEIKSGKLDAIQSSSTEENKEKNSSASVRAPYVSRKITLSNRKMNKPSEDEPKGKRSKWGSLASQKASQTINISTDSLKNWFPDFKLLKDPVNELVLEEPASLVKEEVDTEVSANNKTDEDFKQGPSRKKAEEPPQQEVVMDSTPEDVGPVSKILFIQNLVRPFTLNQLKELLRETGNFIEEDFWIDKIKSKCFVTYESEEEAIKTRNALNGNRWPSSNPKILSVEFSNEEQLDYHRTGGDLPKPIQQLAPEPVEVQESRATHPADEYRKKDHEQERKRDRSKQQPIREWDKDKIKQESPDREHIGKDVEKSKPLDKKDKKDSKRRTNEDTPAKLLDDLFQKTKSSPCIYWLPLTDEQVQERAESQRLRRLEREKRNQQRDQEDTEIKTKRPRSRNRTRETETRRSSTRSRSPIPRRR